MSALCEKRILWIIQCFISYYLNCLRNVEFFPSLFVPICHRLMKYLCCAGTGGRNQSRWESLVSDYDIRQRLHRIRKFLEVVRCDSMIAFLSVLTWDFGSNLSVRLVNFGFSNLLDKNFMKGLYAFHCLFLLADTRSIEFGCCSAVFIAFFLLVIIS